jgi:hypothetical protein
MSKESVLQKKKRRPNERLGKRKGNKRQWLDYVVKLLGQIGVRRMNNIQVIARVMMKMVVKAKTVATARKKSNCMCCVLSKEQMF